MHRLPLADELPYRFHSPQVKPWLVRATKGFRTRMLRVDHRVEQVEIEGIEHLRPLLERGDGILLAPNHCDRADGLVLMELADRIDRPTCTMAAYQLFAGNAGLRHWLFPRLGIFPVDREGSDLSAVKAAVEVLVEGRHPLVVFPEGEVYHLADRITPLREGVAFLAASAAKKAADTGRTVWIVPVGVKYRFLDDHDPLPALSELMDRLECRFTWFARRHVALVKRINHYAAAMLALKEIEYWGEPKPGPLEERIAGLRSHILGSMETRHLGNIRGDDVPSRIKGQRHHCLDRLGQEVTGEAERKALRHDLNDLFVAVQLFSYPGDYVRECPTVERAAEVLTKFEEDVLGPDILAPPRGPRRAIVKLGEPIDVGSRFQEGKKLRQIVSSLTTDLESRIQLLLNQIGPGRLLNVPRS